MTSGRSCAACWSVLTSRPPPKRRDFLTYIVEEYLAGCGGKNKGVSIAMSFFGRDETFNQQIDSIVRLEARPLRQDIDS